MQAQKESQKMSVKHFRGSPYALMNSLYGNFRQRKFTDIWENVDGFTDDYKNCGIPATINDNSITTLYYLLYSRYGNSTISSSDETQFKYKLMSLIFQYGPTWEKRLEIQDAIRSLDLKELQDSATAIYNHAYNPSTAPATTDTAEQVMGYINDQNVTLHKRSKTDAYALLMSLLETDVTEDFLNRFKKLFLTVVEPELPLWYISEGDDE